MSKNSRVKRQQEKSRIRNRTEREDEIAFERGQAAVADINGNGNGHDPHTSTVRMKDGFMDALDNDVALIERGEPLPAVPQTKREAVARVGEIVERARGQRGSKQPRFSAQDANGIFASVLKWVGISGLTEPANASARQMDQWYLSLMQQEPHLAGVVSSIVSIDKNRHYTVTGGRNQVNRVLDILSFANDGGGWREYCSDESQAYWCTRIGAVTELGREGRDGPLRALWSVDPTKLELTGNPARPLIYHSGTAGSLGQSIGAKQYWLPTDYARAASMISIEETNKRLGFPFVARALDLARIMIAVWQHDKEQLGAKAPRGLLILQGITDEMWAEAMTAREEALLSLRREYYGGLSVLTGDGAIEIKAQLMALSQLPENFSIEKWVSTYMYGLALCAGYDPREFYPVSGGALGTGTETDVQHRKASSKGDLDFSLAHQERLQAELPETILFEYEQRDVDGEIADFNLYKLKVDVVDVMSKWISEGASVLTRDEIRQVAAQHGVIPQEWTAEEENVVGDDSEPNVDETLANERIRRAVEVFPDEPLVRFESKTGRTRTLAQRGGDLLQRRSHPNPRGAKIARGSEENHQRILKQERDLSRAAAIRWVYQSAYPLITRTVESAVSDFADNLTSAIDDFFGGGTLRVGDVRELVSAGIYRAYTQALKEGGIPEDEIGDDDFAAMDALTIQQTSFVGDFVKAIRDAKGDETAEDGIRARITLWVNSVRAAGTAGLASAKGNEMVEFRLVGDESEESCGTCEKLLGQRHRRSWTVNHGYEVKPGNENFICGCWNCPHSWEPVRK